MQIIEVKTNKDIKAFHQVPKIVYKDDANWVCQFEGEIEKIFSPEMNVFFKNGELATGMDFTAKNAFGTPVKGVLYGKYKGTVLGESF